ncbi:HD domain-containing phosphohydrolase [Desulfurivibrio sp. C05AmB]|uniref:HD domain-containing phosphohydrolase n=1 Tax=Desulfurivibrio sp. C05AmB TaxID=3374371 RepID=UPI00376F3538
MVIPLDNPDCGKLEPIETMTNPAKPSFFGLRGRLLLIPMAMFFLLVGVIVWHTIEQGEEKKVEAQSRLLAEVKLLAARQQAVAAHAEAISLALTANPALQPGASTAECETALRLKQQRNPGFINIGLARPDGSVMCSAHPGFNEVNFSDRIWFQQALQLERLVVSDVVTGRITGVTLFTFAKTLQGPQEEVTGVLFLAMDLSWLKEDLAGIRPQEEARILLMDGTGLLVARYPDQEGLAGGSARQILQDAVKATEAGVLEIPGVTGEWRFYAFAPLFETVAGQMTLFLSLPREMVLAQPWRKLRNQLLGASLVLALIFGLVYWYGDRLLVRPLLTLSATAARFGAGDHTARSGLPHSDDEIGRLARTMDETAAAIQAAEEEVAHANRALRTLSAGNQTLVRATDETQLLRSICRVAVEEGGYCLAWVGYVDDNPEGTLIPKAWAGLEGESVSRALAAECGPQDGEGTMRCAIAAGKAQIVLGSDSDSPGIMDLKAAIPALPVYTASFVLPLVVKEKIIGVLSIHALERDAFNEYEVALLTELAHDLSFGIETLRIRAERDLIAYRHQHHAEILQKSLEQSIQAIASTVEARDYYTAGHQRRVADLAVAIGRELSLPEDKIHGLHLAGVVHDLGKIQIPSEILTKPTRLSDIEFMLVNTHPQVGYAILKDIEFPWPIAEIVFQHHEKMDGSGYPRGLKGGEILLEARIMTVADVVEAMASHRPYRPTLGTEQALAEIERGRGRQYDPLVVDACLRVFRERAFSWET